MSRSKIKLPVWGYVLLCGILFLPLLLKYLLSSVIMAEKAGDGWSSVLAIIQHDSGVYFAIFVLSILANRGFVPAMLAFGLRFLVFLIFLVYSLDVLTARIFFIRLNLEDVVKFVDEVPKYLLGFLEQLLSPAQLLTTFVVLAVLGLVVLKWRRVLVYFYGQIEGAKTLARINLACLLVSGSCYALMPKHSYVHDWYYQNIFEYLYIVSGYLKPYSEEKRQDLLMHKDDLSYLECRAGPIKKPNIVIVLLESWSMKHGQFFSGIGNSTPFLDKLAAQNTSFVRFYANGFTTEDGLIAILAGRQPLPAPGLFSVGGNTSFKGFRSFDNALPSVLSKEGYRTEFITSGNLSFINKRAWLESLGYDYIEGHENPAYNGYRKHIFNSSPDTLLYERVMKRLHTMHKDGTSPLFLTVETVSSHMPFKHPITSERSEASVFRYADESFKVFYSQLEAAGFFSKGLLIVVSDHRSMTPVTAKEIDLYGYARAPALVPMIIVDANRPAQKIDAVFQQTDILPSLQGMVSGNYCHNRWQGNFFDRQSESADYIFHKRGDRRDIVSVYSAIGDFQVRLNGDKTHFEGSGGMQAKTQRMIVDYINLQRLIDAEDESH